MKIVSYGIVAALCILALYIVIPWGAKLIMRQRFLATAKALKMVFLTFDDGPDPESTPRLLGLLKKVEAKATFFVLGKNVERYPDLAKKIIEDGHEIGEHSYEHLHAWKTGPLRTLRDLVRGERVLQSVSHVSNHRVLFRPPFGKINLATLLYIWLRRKQVAFWNIDPKDYEAVSAQEVANHVIQRLGPGVVILLHDGRLSGNSNVHVTTGALGPILEACKSKGLHPTSLGGVRHKRGEARSCFNIF
jgi:peptidoglycan/xylan/chitin deacetylase (PgdA/CDA1 family)